MTAAHPRRRDARLVALRAAVGPPGYVHGRGARLLRIFGCGSTPVTSTIRGVPSEVVVGTEAGLREPSAINLHHVATVPSAGLRTFVGSVPASTMQQVREALLFALGFVDPPR